MAGEEVSIPIGVPVQTNAAEAADDVGSLRDQILESTSAIKSMLATQRNLRGSTDEIKSARAQLTSKINAEKDATTAATLKLRKQGVAYDESATKMKKAKEEKARLDSQMKVTDFRAQSQMFGLSSAIEKAGGASGLASKALMGLAAAGVAVAAGVLAGAVSLGKFILTSGNAARSANLLREAWYGTSKNAANMGTQIDALAQKIPLPREQLNELSIELAKMRIGGQTGVDALNAIGQASAALGDEAGNKLKEFLERGRMVNKFRLDPREMLEGFGNLQFTDVAESLAKSMHVGVNEAKKALAEGRVSLGDGAKAMRDAVQKKFGGLNLRKMLDLNVLAQKAGEAFDALTKNVDLEPLLKDFGELGQLITGNTVTGKTLRGLVTTFGNGMVTALREGVPLAKTFFETLVLYSLKAENASLKLRVALKGVLGDKSILKDGEGVTLALKGAEWAAKATVVSFIALAAAGAIVAAPFVLAAREIMKVGRAIESAKKAFKDTDWAALGSGITDGIAQGITSGKDKVVDALRSLASFGHKAYKDAEEQHSPSKKYARFGEQIPAGAAEGVKRNSGAYTDAIKDMAGPAPTAMAPAGAAGGGATSGPREIHVHIHTGSGEPRAIVQELRSSGTLAMVVKIIEDALVGDGIAVMT